MHLGRWHVHGSSHDGLVLSGVRLLVLPAFFIVKHFVVVWANKMFGNACVALLCQSILKLFIVQHNSRWR